MFREMRRFKQQLATDECEQILASAPRGVLSVLGDDDYPYGIPLDFVYESGKLYFHSALVGHKLDAIAAHDKASFCVLDEGTRNEGEWWWRFRSVIAFGRVRVIEDEDEKRAALLKLGNKYFPTDYDTEDDVARNWSRVAMIELTIEHLSGKRVQEK